MIRGGRIAAVLDAKYRDLWEQPLPREMLYQLALYALGHRGTDRRAAILYPTLDPAAREQVISIHEPMRAALQAHIILRPVNLLTLEMALREKAGRAARERQAAFAYSLAFGPQPLNN